LWKEAEGGRLVNRKFLNFKYAKNQSSLSNDLTCVVPNVDEDGFIMDSSRQKILHVKDNIVSLEDVGEEKRDQTGQDWIFGKPKDGWFIIRHNQSSKLLTAANGSKLTMNGELLQ
jgi:hypothetical protein